MINVIFHLHYCRIFPRDTIWTLTLDNQNRIEDCNVETHIDLCYLERRLSDLFYTCIIILVFLLYLTLLTLATITLRTLS